MRSYDDRLDRMALAGGRGAGLGSHFKDPVDPVLSARAKAAAAAISPEKRAEMTRKAVATRAANAEAAKAEAEAAYQAAYNAKVAQLAAKLGRQPTVMDLVMAGDEEDDEA